MSEQLANDQLIVAEMGRQLNFARSRAKTLRDSAVEYFRNNNVGMAYRCEGGAEELDCMIAQFEILRTKIALGEGL